MRKQLARRPRRSGAVPSIRQAASSATRAMMEGLEDRRLLSATILRPDHVVVVIEEDRFSDAIGDLKDFPYLNSLVANSLVYTNSHGVGHPSEPNYLALFSGSTQGVTDNGTGHTFTGTANLASALNSTMYNGAYMSFIGYSENIPKDGDTTTKYAGDSNPSDPPDLYVRNYNPMAMFTNDGTQNGVAVANAKVNAKFNEFPASATGFANMATVSYVIPNNLHNTHGSNEQAPWAADPSDYDQLRLWADQWLQQNLSAYAQWAASHNSLLIITGDEEETDSSPTSTISTLITGDPRLFVSGTNSTSVNHFNVVRTLEDMYGLSYLGNTSSVADLPTNGSGQLTPTNVVNKLQTGTVLQTSNGATVFGQSVTFTATVTAASGTPTGSVSFYDGGTLLGAGTLNSSGVATLALTSLSVGGHTITATYGGDSNDASSTSGSVSQSVAQASSSIGLSASSQSTVVGQSVTFTAAVTVVSPGSGKPSGTVTFTDGGTTIGAGTLNASGVATLTLSSLALGGHSIMASYGGSASYTAVASGALALNVNPDNTNTALASSKNPATPGTSVTFTATVTVAAPGAGKPTGTVSFYDGAALLGSGTLNSSGVATYSTSTLSTATHSITAVYSGDANDLTSTSAILSQQVTATVTTPAAPTGVTASSNFSDRVEITWAPSSGATSYLVYRYTSNKSGSAAKIGTTTGAAIYEDTTAVVGTTYYYWVKASNSAGTSGFSAAATGKRIATTNAPANDNFAYATVISGTSISVTGSNTNGTKEAGEPNIGNQPGGKSVWWVWTAPTSGTVTIDTKGSSFDTTMSVFTGTSVSSLTTIAYNDDDWANSLTTSKVTFAVTAGTTYYIAVDGYGGVSGSIKLNLSLT